MNTSPTPLRASPRPSLLARLNPDVLEEVEASSSIIAHQRRNSNVSQDQNPFDNADDFSEDEEEGGRSEGSEGGFVGDGLGEDLDARSDEVYGLDQSSHESEEGGSDDSFGTPGARRVGSDEATSSTFPLKGSSKRNAVQTNSSAVSAESPVITDVPAKTTKSPDQLRRVSVGSQGSSCGSVQFVPGAAEIDELQKRLEAATAAKNEAETNLSAKEIRLAELQKNNDKAESELSSYQEEVRQLRAEKAKLQDHAKDLEKQKTSAEKFMKEKQQELDAIDKTLKLERSRHEEEEKLKDKEIHTLQERVAALEREAKEEKDRHQRHVKKMEPVLENLNSNMQLRLECLVTKEKRQHDLVMKLQNELLDAREREIDNEFKLKSYKTEVAEQNSRIVEMEKTINLWRDRYENLSHARVPPS